MRRFMYLAVPIVLLFPAAQARAATIQIGSVAALGANDFFDWAQVLPEGAAIASPVNIASNLGRTGTIDDGGEFTPLVEGTDFLGNFTAGDHLLFTGNATDASTAAHSITMNFSTAIAGLGLQIHSNLLGDFTASLEVFNGATSIGLFSIAGVTDGSGDGSAPFLGAISGAVDIDRAVFTLTSNIGEGFAVNRLLTTDTPTSAQAVPEPATLGLVGMCALGILRSRRQRR